MVFPRTGVFVRRNASDRALVADPTRVVFFNRGENYRVAHPVPGGDDCTAFSFEENALLSYLQRRYVDTSAERPFPVSAAQTTASVHLSLYRLRQLLRSVGKPTALSVEEAAVELLSQSTRPKHSHATRALQKREDTRRANRDLVRAARLFLMRKLGEKFTLEDIAASVFSSPFHLARVFRSETGVTLHHELNRLRLRHALAQLADGVEDLTRLALELGYSSHSHFTWAFAREFRQAPSVIRRQLSSRLLRKLGATRHKLVPIALALVCALGACRPCAAQSPPMPASEPQLFAPNVISTGDDESHPAFTPDGKTLYFLKNDPSFNHWTIVVSHEQNGNWSTPEVAPFSGQYSDADPFITPDGERMFFISTRSVNGKAKEDTDIWMMKKTGAGWSEPEHVDQVNSENNEWFPTVSKNGNLYFGSERPGGKGRCDLYRSRLLEGKYQPPENLGEPINSAANEVEPLIAPDESYIIFAGTSLPESRGAYDLYVSFQRDGAWTKPRNLGDQVNSAAWDFSPKVSPGGKWFFFTSNRSFADKPLKKRLSYKELLQKLHAPRNGLRDIYKIDISALDLRN